MDARNKCKTFTLVVNDNNKYFCKCNLKVKIEQKIKINKAKQKHDRMQYGAKKGVDISLSLPYYRSQEMISQQRYLKLNSLMMNNMLNFRKLRK